MFLGFTALVAGTNFLSSPAPHQAIFSPLPIFLSGTHAV